MSDLSKLGISFILSILAGILVSSIVESQIKLTVIVLTVLVLMNVYAVFSINSISQKTERQLDKIGMLVDWTYGEKGARKSFQEATQIVKAAKSRILVISPYIPSDLVNASRILRPRKDYLTDGIEHAIKQHLNSSPSERFEYTRILQSEMAAEFDKDLSRGFPGIDDQTFDHCVRVQEMVDAKSKGTRTQIIWKISQPIDQISPFMIVDDGYLLFLFGARNPAAKRPVDKFVVYGSLAIEDRGGNLISDFALLFQDFSERGTRIESFIE